MKLDDPAFEHVSDMSRKVMFEILESGGVPREACFGFVDDKAAFMWLLRDHTGGNDKTKSLMELGVPLSYAGVSAILHLADTWFSTPPGAPLDKDALGREIAEGRLPVPRDDPDRKEGLMELRLVPGENRIYTIPYRREDGKIIKEDPLGPGTFPLNVPASTMMPDILTRCLEPKAHELAQAWPGNWNELVAITVHRGHDYMPLDAEYEVPDMPGIDRIRLEDENGNSTKGA